MARTMLNAAWKQKAARFIATMDWTVTGGWDSRLAARGSAVSARFAGLVGFGFGLDGWRERARGWTGQTESASTTDRYL